MDAILLCMKKRGIRFFRQIRFPNTNVVRTYEKTSFLSLLRIRRAQYDNVLIMAHGDNDCILTTTSDLHHPYRKYITCEETNAFENDFVFAVSCLTANKFGEECKEKGCIAYLGYQIEISSMFSAELSHQSQIPGSVIVNTNILLKRIFISSLSKSYEEFLTKPMSVKLLRARFSFELEKQLVTLAEMSPQAIHEKYGVKICNRHFTLYATEMILTVLENINEIMPRLICIGDENYISSSFIRYKKKEGISSAAILQELEGTQAFKDLQHVEYKAYLKQMLSC